MRVTRRSFNGWMVGAGASLASGTLARAGSALGTSRARRSQASLFRIDGVADGANVVFEQGGNSLLLAPKGGRGAGGMLVDCKNPGFGAALRRAVRDHGADLSWVVNTHHHGDHTGGNTGFTADLPVIAHRACAKRCEDQLERYLQRARQAMVGLGADQSALRADLEEIVGPDASPSVARFVPNDLIKGDEREMAIGGERVLLRHVGSGHTDNDVFVWCPDHNILHTGDLVFNGLNPYIDTDGGSTTRGWDRSLAAMITLCNDNTVVIPGHGPVGDVGILRKQAAYFDALRSAVQPVIKAGKSRDEAMHLKPKILKGLGFEQLGPRNLGVVFDELTDEA